MVQWYNTVVNDWLCHGEASCEAGSNLPSTLFAAAFYVVTIAKNYASLRDVEDSVQS